MNYSFYSIPIGDDMMNYNDIFFKKNYHKLVILLKPDDKDTEHMNPAEIIDYLKIRIIEQNKENIKLKLELSTSLEDKPRLEKLLQGIPEERIQFFINNQMRSFITMERANLKKQLFYEQANKSIRHTKQTAIQADFEETGKRVRKQTLKFTLPS